MHIPAEAAKKTNSDSDPASYLFRIDAFRNSETTGAAARGTRVEQDTVEMSPLVDQYQRFLDRYVRNLEDINRTDPAVLSTPEHADEKLLLKMLEGEDDADRLKKIDKFLSDPKGWVLATQALERQTRYMQSALALFSQAGNPGSRTEMGATGKVQTGEDMGAVRRLWEDKLKKYGDLIGAVGVGSGVLGTVGFFAGGPKGAVIGAAIPPAAAAATLAGRDLWKEGATYQNLTSAQAFQTLKNSLTPGERGYVEKMYGIDLNDFQISGNTVIPDPNRPQRSTGIDDLQNSVAQNLKTRRDFYLRLNVPKDKLDTLPEEFLLKGYTGMNDLRLEDTNLRMQRRFLEYYNPRTAIQDSAHRHAGQPGFNPNFLDVEGNLRRFEQARVRMMADEAQEYIKYLESTKVPDRKNSISALKEKIAAREGGGSIHKDAQKPFEAEKKSLEDNKTRLQEEEGSLQSYQSTVETLEKEQSKVAVEFAAIPGADIDAKIRYVQDRLNISNPPTGSSIEEQLWGVDAYILSEIPKRVAALTMPAGSKARDAAEQAIGRQVNAEADVMRRRLSETKTQLEERVRKLEEAKRTIQEQQNRLNESGAIATEGQKTMDNLQSDFGTLIAWRGITEARLASESFEQLLKRINDAHTANPRQGWPEAENRNSERRSQLLHAIIEAKAERRAALDVDRGLNGRDAAFNRLRSMGVTENQLRTLSIDQIAKVLEDLSIQSGGARGATPALTPFLRTGPIENAQIEARQRLRLRREVTQEEIKDLDKLIQEENEKIEGVDFNREKEQFNVVVDLLDNQEHVFSNVGKIVRGSDVDKYMNLQKAGAKDTTYTEAERDVKAAKGYYEFLNLMFDYQERHDRNAYFKKVEQVLPPKRLAKLLNEGLDLGFDSRYDKNLQRVLAEIHIRIDDREIDRADMRHAMVYIMDRLKDEALALS